MFYVYGVCGVYEGVCAMVFMICMCDVCVMCGVCGRVWGVCCGSRSTKGC